MEPNSVTVENLKRFEGKRVTVSVATNRCGGIIFANCEGVEIEGNNIVFQLENFSNMAIDLSSCIVTRNRVISGDSILTISF